MENTYVPNVQNLNTLNIYLNTLITLLWSERMCPKIWNACVLIHALSVLIRTFSMPFRTVLTLRALFTLVFCVPCVPLCLRVYDLSINTQWRWSGPWGTLYARDHSTLGYTLTKSTFYNSIWEVMNSILLIISAAYIHLEISN